jgi:hypothetical protein
MTVTTVTTTVTTEASPSSLEGKTLSIRCTRGVGEVDPEFLFTLYRTAEDPGTTSRLPELVASWMLPGGWRFNESLTAVIFRPEKIQLEDSTPLTLSYGRDAEQKLPEFMAQLGARIREATQKIEAAYPDREVTIAYKF